MTTTQELVQQEITAKIALALVEELTHARILALVRDELNRKDGYHSKPFLEDLINRTIRDAIRLETERVIIENEAIIHAAVRKVVSKKLIEKLAENIEVNLSRAITIKVNVDKDDD